MAAKPAFAETYLAKLSADKRATLEKVRKAIRAAAPDAEEGMSYGLPAFIQGKPIAGFGASANHCAYYPMSGAIVAAMKGELGSYETSKGAIKFPIGKPLPPALIRKLVQARLAEVGARGATKSKVTVMQPRNVAADVKAALAYFERHGSVKFREDMAARYGITTQDKTFGVPMASIQKLAKGLGRSHELALALWATGVYEARILVSYVDEPARLTPKQMDAYARDFDNWAVVDTLCFKLFDQTPHAWAKVEQWTKRREEFVKRAGFALLACLALHTKGGDNAPFLRALALIGNGASDERNFVKKGVSWALRAIGGKRDPALKSAAIEVAERLATSAEAGPRWIGKDALRALSKR
jgi:3-methyladenine DNA glycosylase AlkD